MEIYRGRLIAYSLGNFSGFHNFATEGVLGASAVLHVTLDPDGAFRSGRIASVRLVEAGQPVPDPSGEGAADHRPALPRRPRRRRGQGRRQRPDPRDGGRADEGRGRLKLAPGAERDAAVSATARAGCGRGRDGRECGERSQGS